MEIVKHAKRLYECRECGHQMQFNTNHRIDCYPICEGKCRQILSPHTRKEVVLSKVTAHKYIKDIN